MKRSFILFSFILLTLFGQTQNLTLKWANHIGSDQQDYIFDHTIDAEGNMYATGAFTGTVDMDSGPGVVLLSSNGFMDIFIRKLDALGNFVWAKQIGSSHNDLGSAIAMDNSGNIYITGQFYYTADFDPGPGIFNLTTASNGSFLLKLTKDGSFIWAKQLSGSGKGESITITSSGNIYVAGVFQYTWDFDPGPGVSTMSSLTNYMDVFITKLDNNGNFRWAKQFAGTSYKGCNSVITDAQENVYVVGQFKFDCDFDPGPGTFTLTQVNPSINGWDIFLVKLDVYGNFVWANQTGGSGVDIPGEIILDPSGNIYMSGSFSGAVDFDPGPGTSIITGGNNSANTFILKLNNNGNLTWAKSFSGTSPCYGHTIALDVSGDIYVGGQFTGTIDFDAGTDVAALTVTVGGAETYICKMDKDGNFKFVRCLPGEGNYCVAIRADPIKNIYLAGYFSGTTDFDTGPASYNLTSAGFNTSDAFMAKYSQCLLNTSSTVNATACNSYTLNGYVYTNTGTYVQTIPNAAGCDSIITLNLVMGGSTTTTAVTACESYTWEGQTYTSNGTYTVTYTGADGCDSIRRLNLIITQDVNTTINATICQGQNYAGHTVAGVYTDTYLTTSGCDSVRTLYLTVDPGPSNFLKPTDSICMNDKLLLTPLNSYPEYFWSTGAVQSSVMIQNPGLYWLQVKNNNGCTGRDSTIVFSKQCPTGVFIPTAFTPNNDGRNDVLKATVHGNLIQFKLYVYDRNGQLIFQINDPQKGWNGTHKGIPVPVNIYVWQCTYQLQGSEPQLQKGTLAVIR